MNKSLAEILAANLEYIKVNNIEKSMGLKKTALVRMIARKEIPAKYKQQVEDWWNQWQSKISTVSITIYKLINPIDNNVFYVGKTIGSIESRLNAHVKETEDGCSSKKRETISSILKKDNYPIIESIETFTCSCAEEELKINERELYWIEYYNNLNELTNVEGIIRPYKHKLTNKSKAEQKSYENNLKDADKWTGEVVQQVDVLIQQRIEELEKELKNPPKTAQIGVRNWIRIREQELKQLNKQ